MNREDRTVDPKFIVELKGKPFVMLGGLLDLAHRIGLQAIETAIVEKFSQPEKDTWVVQAFCRFSQPEGEPLLWSGYGDAGPGNSQMRGAYLRHAETRAIARALRWATNIAMAAVEELGPDSEATNGHQDAPQRPQQAQRAKHDPKDTAERKAAEASPAVAMCAICGQPVDERTAEVSRRKFDGVVLCVADGKARLAGEREPSAILQGA